MMNISGISRESAEVAFSAQPVNTASCGAKPFMHFNTETGEDVQNIPDIIEGEAYRAGSAAQRALVELCGARSYLGIALRKEGALPAMPLTARLKLRDKQAALAALARHLGMI
jgi:hypothetical protein